MAKKATKDDPAEEQCRRAWWKRGPNEFEQEIENLKAPDGGALIPWMLMVLGPATDVIKGEVPMPWLAASGLAAFCGLYVSTIKAAFSPRWRTGRLPYELLGALAALVLSLSIGYGGNFMLLFVLVSLCAGCVSRSRRALGLMLIPLSAAAGIVSGLHHEGFWSTASLSYGTFLSGLVVSVIITLFHAVDQLKSTRQELARNAVAEERLRFSRDLHDLLGHTLSVVVVKAEAARRLAPRNLEAALTQVGDIESVGRQALTEIREAVTGYREGSLSTELDRARSALAASDIEVVLQESGPPLPPQTEALLGWVVREGVTNVVRHSGATLTRIELRCAEGLVHLTITDNGQGPAASAASGTTATLQSTRTGTGLRGLTERLAAAGGSLTSGPSPAGGFRVAAVLPVGEDG
ncbi:sensor histidine kinase [Streptomyces cocklensis]|jgi:two-component system sensor histidine kinase DesK|nr:sensor histidine kinase [Actinacidiphila cocklensis]MDD1062397.1 sensor histidine kinase [Actinacidiphila cocklensis]WSX74277.1 sensor histidine kinase [Streptomyces sp. NBC_00899]WSX79658.1 sensor histidine kinase [Streptomyces sp. NBC_00899]